MKIKLNDQKLKKIYHLFWEYDLKELDLSADKDLILKKILAYGSVEDLKDLISMYGKSKIKQFLLKIKGKGIDKRRLKFYQVVFRLPKREVDSWLRDPLRKIWKR